MSISVLFINHLRLRRAPLILRLWMIWHQSHRDRGNRGE